MTYTKKVKRAEIGKTYADKKTGIEYQLMGFTKTQILIQNESVEGKLTVKKGLDPETVFMNDFKKVKKSGLNLGTVKEKV